MSAYDVKSGMTLHKPKGCGNLEPHEVLQCIRSREYGRQGRGGYAIAAYARNSTPAQRASLDALLDFNRPTSVSETCGAADGEAS
jgi:hypothetical protein